MVVSQKINSNNAFSTEVIENLELAVGMDEEETNFQQASCALDAGVKIYEKRVDNVHQSTLKMLGGINRATDDVTEDAEGADDDDLEEEEEEDTEEVKKKPKRKKANTQTIETNLANINMRAEELCKVFDPLFHMMSGKFDEGGARGMLLHNLNVSTGGGIIFDSLPPADTDGADTLEEESMNPFVAPALLKTLKMTLSNKGLCPEFDQYTRNVETDEEKKAEHAAMVASASQEPEIESDPEDSFLGGDDGDDFLAETSEMDFAHDDTASEHSPMPGAVEAVSRMTSRPTWNQMVHALDDGINFADEYSFFSKKLQGSWAGGPGQWKPVSQSQKEQGRKHKAEKLAVVIEFNTVAEMDFGSSFELPAKAGANSLSDNAIEKSIEAASTLLLPSDHQYKAQELLSLFSRRNKRVRRYTAALGRAGGSEGGAVEAYNYANAADTAFTVPQAFENDDHFEGGFDDDDDVGGGDASGAFGFDMVAEPTKVEKIEVHYERTAKKVDVKKLKESLWHKIDGEEAATKPTQEEPLLFTEVLKDLPDSMSKEQAESVSVPFCFICLLHLANEKTLELHDSDDLSQITVSCSA